MGNKFELKFVEDCGGYSKYELEADKESVDELVSQFFTDAVIKGIETISSSNRASCGLMENSQRLHDAASLLNTLLLAWEVDDVLDYEPKVRMARERLTLVLDDIKFAAGDPTIGQDCESYAEHDEYVVTRNLLRRAAAEIKRLRGEAA